MRQIFLIGTSHTLQKIMPEAPEAEFNEFMHLIRSAVETYGIRSIGEEMSEEALGRSLSLCRIIAQRCGLSHMFCDPTKTERLALGLQIEDDQSTWSGREGIWLDRIQYAEFPVLYICGANHIDTFPSECLRRGFTVKVLEQDWHPRTLPSIQHRII